MTPYFKLFNETLLENRKNYPRQFYSKNYSEFFEQFHNYIYENKNLIPKICILVDGAFKKSCLQNNKSIDSIFIENLSVNFEIINLSTICNKPSSEIHASEFFFNKLCDALKNTNATHFVSLGSGTVTDLMKHALHMLQKSNDPFISIPTATTVTAFTSAFSVIEINGVKRTRPSRSIQCTFWIEPLLCAAPAQFIKAGFGDLCAFFVSFGDWYLGSQLGFYENYDENLYNLMLPYLPFLLTHVRNPGPSEPGYSRSLIRGESNLVSNSIPPTLVGSSIKNEHSQNYLEINMELFSQTLAMAGIVMSLCKQTTPLSGFEHVISHGLDFLNANSTKEINLHGEQVALGVLTSAITFEWLLEQNELTMNSSGKYSHSDIEKLMFQLLNKAPFENGEKKYSKDELLNFVNLFKTEYFIKHEKWENLQIKVNNFIQNWPVIKTHLKKLVIPVNLIENVFNKVGLPICPEYASIKVTSFEYRWAVRFSPFFRERFCISDLIFWLGEDPCAIALL